MTKVIFLIADGMGGWPLESLGGLTTLEAAQCPTMDFMASHGQCGCCQTIPQGMAPGSDVANMSLLGYDPVQYHTGRGPIEAAAQGLALHPDDLIWRMNLVSVSDFSDQGTMLDYSAGHISTATAAPLLKHLTHLAQGTEFTPYLGIQYRHLLVQENGATSPTAQLTLRPPHDILDQPIAEDLAQLAKHPNLAKFMTQAHLFLTKDHTSKANAIWPWGQGRPLNLPNFTQTFGLQGAVISAVDLVKGLGRAAGMEVLNIAGATGLIDTNYAGKVEAALEFLKHGDFVYIHVEAPDECGHMGDPELKKQAIELFDQRIAAPMLAALKDTDAIFLLTCDHFTPVTQRTHTPDPVPFVMYSPRRPQTDGPAVFTEASAKACPTFLKSGQELMAFVLDNRP